VRIAKAMLDERVDSLNVVLNRPRVDWTLYANPKTGNPDGQSNVGHFLLDTYPLGDEWMRYALCVVVGNRGEQSSVSPGYTSQEMDAYLLGVLAVLDSQSMCDGGKTATFEKWAKPKAVQS
jgi:hypothetical protein